MDIPSIAAILSALTNSIEITKRISSSDNPLGKAEVKLQFANLISELADAKVEITNIQQQLLEKDKQIRDLNEQVAAKEKLKYEKPYYWHVEGENKDGPFCQVCYDKNDKHIRLQGNNNGYWKCRVCKNNYVDSAYVKQPNW